MPRDGPDLRRSVSRPSIEGDPKTILSEMAREIEISSGAAIKTLIGSWGTYWPPHGGWDMADGRSGTPGIGHVPSAMRRPVRWVDRRSPFPRAGGPHTLVGSASAAPIPPGRASERPGPSRGPIMVRWQPTRRRRAWIVSVLLLVAALGLLVLPPLWTWPATLGRARGDGPSRHPGARGRRRDRRPDSLVGGIRPGRRRERGPGHDRDGLPARLDLQADHRRRGPATGRAGQDRPRRADPALRPELSREGVAGHAPPAAGAPRRRPPLPGGRAAEHAALRQPDRGAGDLPGRPAGGRARDEAPVFVLRLQPARRGGRGGVGAAV